MYAILCFPKLDNPILGISPVTRRTLKTHNLQKQLPILRTILRGPVKCDDVLV